MKGTPVSYPRHRVGDIVRLAKGWTLMTVIGLTPDNEVIAQYGTNPDREDRDAWLKLATERVNQIVFQNAQIAMRNAQPGATQEPLLPVPPITSNAEIRALIEPMYAVVVAQYHVQKITEQLEAAAQTDAGFIKQVKGLMQSASPAKKAAALAALA